MFLLFKFSYLFHFQLREERNKKYPGILKNGSWSSLADSVFGFNPKRLLLLLHNLIRSQDNLKMTVKIILALFHFKNILLVTDIG